MSTNVFSPPPGLAWPIVRTPLWQTRRQQNVSGKEVNVKEWSSPRYQWKFVISVLRRGLMYGINFAELDNLFGFFNNLQGGGESFLYQDQDDNSVTGQLVATGDGHTTSFQLQRAYGGSVGPILAPNLLLPNNVYLNGVKQATNAFAISPWGAGSPGLLTVFAPPQLGVAITADFSYYFPVRFDDDKLDFEKFLQNYFELKSMSWTSLK